MSTLLAPTPVHLPPSAVPDAVRPATRLVFGVYAGLTLLAAGTLTLLAGNTDRFFAWTIKAEPSAAFYGAAYAAGFVLSVRGLVERRWSHLRVSLATVTIFSTLTLLPTLLHRHLLHLASDVPSARFAAWFWLVVYVVIPVAGAYALVRQARAGRGALSSSRSRRPIGPWLTLVLAAQGMVLLGVGVVLYAKGAGLHHAFPAAALSFWPWTVGPLGAQVVGAWLIALGVATALVLYEGDLERLAGPALTYAAFGAFQLLVTLRYADQVRPDDQSFGSYVVVLMTMTLAGAYGWWQARGRLHSE